MTHFEQLTRDQTSCDVRYQVLDQLESQTTGHIRGQVVQLRMAIDHQLRSSWELIIANTAKNKLL